MMVGYVHDWTTLWRICYPAFQVVRLQWNVIFDQESTAHAPCLQGDENDIVEIPEETEYVEGTEKGGDGNLHDHSWTSGTGEGHGSGDHNCTDDDTDHILPDADNRRALPASVSVRTRPPDDDDAPQVSRETVIQNRHLRCENDKARQMTAMTKYSSQPPRTNRIIRSQVKMSANTLIIMAKSLASTSINSDPLSYAEATDRPHRDRWKQAMEEECTSMLLHNTFTTINSWEARQLRVKPIRSKWVYKMKNNPDGTI